MTAAEIIEQIKALPDEEKAKVWDFVLRLEIQTGRPLSGVKGKKSFEEALNNVFKKHDQLFRELAK